MSRDRIDEKPQKRGEHCCPPDYFTIQFRFDALALGCIYLMLATHEHANASMRWRIYFSFKFKLGDTSSVLCLSHECDFEHAKIRLSFHEA